MGTVEPIPGLDAVIAQRVAAPHLQRVLDMLKDAARNKAPEVGVWVTMRDERVRRSHVDTDGQMVPRNVPFILPRPGGGHDKAMHPRDESLPADQKINCRCDDPVLPDELRRTINATPVQINGTVVSGSVETRFPRATESESTAQGGHWMLAALQEVAARLRGGQSR